MAMAMAGPIAPTRRADAMSRRSRPARRTPASWAIRGTAAAIAAALGVAAVPGSMAGRDPAQAHRLAPRDGRWTALLASMLSNGEASVADRQRADVLA